MVVKIDKYDKKILYELDIDARQPLSALAKKVGLSPEVTNYRVKRLVNTGVIRKFITIINTAKLGFLSYRNYMRYQKVSPEKENEIVEYLKNHPNVFWFASLSGGWDLEVLIFARNFYHYNEIMEEILRKYGKYIKENSLSMAVYNTHFKRRYLIERKEEVPTAIYGGEPRVPDVDETDIQLLGLLATNARIPLVELANKLGIVGNAVKYRIKKMTNAGIIQTYRLWLDVNKIGYELHKALVTLETPLPERESQMLSFCQAHPNIIYMIKCNGVWNFEIEAEVRNHADFRGIVLEFRNLFGEIIKNFETLITFKEHKINYFPMGTKEFLGNKL